MITDVLCVPEFQFNLLSVAKLTKELQCCVSFFPDFFIIQDLFNGKVKGIGEERDGLYILNTKIKKESERIKSLNVAECKETAELWHKRMGHAPMSVIRILDIVKNKQAFSFQHYDICPLARQVRLPFPNSDIRASHCFDLIHMDVWGPYKVATHNNMRCFLTLVDDYSRWTWTFLMHLKSDVCTLLKSFLALIKTQFGRQVKVLRSDNGG